MKKLLVLALALASVQTFAAQTLAAFQNVPVKKVVEKDVTLANGDVVVVRVTKVIECEAEVIVSDTTFKAIDDSLQALIAGKNTEAETEATVLNYSQYVKLANGACDN